MENNSVAIIMKQFKQTEHYKIIKEHLELAIKKIEGTLFKIGDPDSNIKLYTKNDLLKIKRSVLLELIDLPDNLIDKDWSTFQDQAEKEVERMVKELS